MLNSSTIILMAIIGLLIILFINGDTLLNLENTNHTNVENTNTKENFSCVKPQPIYRYKYKKCKPESIGELVDDVTNWDNSLSSADVVKEQLNKNLLSIQFHNDYRDVITAINNLIPEKKQRFNISNIPLHYSEPETDEVKLLINDFITTLNINIGTEVPDQRNPNSGWDEAIVDPNTESGWDKVQKSLGLPTSIYNDPAKRQPVKLIAITYVQKYETEDEIKYSIDFVVQKINVKDQMALKGSFVQDKRPLLDENNFFVNKNIELQIIIEDVFITGYLSDDGADSRLEFDLDKEKFYGYDMMEYNNMTDPKYIQKVLMDNYKKRTEEMNHYNALLDEEGQDFHKTLPNLYDYSNITGTRTIFDDMNEKKIFY